MGQSINAAHAGVTKSFITRIASQDGSYWTLSSSSCQHVPNLRIQVGVFQLLTRNLGVSALEMDIRYLVD